MTSMKNSAALWFGLLLLGGSERPIDEPTRAEEKSHERLQLPSLAALSVEALRKRSYHSSLRIEQRLGSDSDSARPYIASYDSDGLRVYARIDVPTGPVPAAGYPVVVFLHGWAGIDAAPTFRFYYADDSNYGEMIDSYGRINVVGHSQGGDVALIVAAVSGEGSSIKNAIAAASTGRERSLQD